MSSLLPFDKNVKETRMESKEDEGMKDSHAWEMRCAPRHESRIKRDGVEKATQSGAEFKSYEPFIFFLFST